MFEEELQFFINNQDKLVGQFEGDTLIIKGHQVIGVYRTPLEAYLDAQKKYESGTYMIQKCEPGKEAYTITLSPVSTISA